MSPAEFAATIRTKHPGAYDDLSDDDLTAKVLAKYPQYGDMVTVDPQARIAEQNQQILANSSQPTQFEQENSYAGQRARLTNQLNALSNLRGQFTTAADEYQKLAQDPNANIGRAGKFALGSTADIMRMGAGATEGRNVLLGAGAVAAPEVVLPYLAYTGAQQALTGRQEGETAADELQRRLMGGAQVAGSLAGAAAQPKTALARLQELRTGISGKISPPNPANAVMANEIGSLPAQAVSGLEDIYRAAAPTATNKAFRGNLYAAAGDLADVARKVELAESRGGIVNPDMRVRATVQALDDHLAEMYQAEHAPQIQKHADVPVDIALGDATRGLQFLKRSAGTLREQFLADKALKGSLTLAEADELAMTANQYLKSYERMTAPEKLEAVSKTPKIAGLKALDVELGNKINDTLTANGEVGLRSYERRFAAVSEIRDQLGSRMNAVELNQPGRIKAVIRPAIAAITGGKVGIASASQAAIADVNIGKLLETGLKKLDKSRISASARRGFQSPSRSQSARQRRP